MEDLDDQLAKSASVTDGLTASTSSVTSLSGRESAVGVTSAQALAARSRKGPLKKGGKAITVACWAHDAKEPELIGECTVPIEEVLKKGEVDGENDKLAEVFRA
jgi:hypothetical protein